MSTRDKGRGGKAKAPGRGGNAPRGRGHGLKPSQRRDAKKGEDSIESKKASQIRERLGGLVEILSDEKLISLLKKFNLDVDETCDAIMAGNTETSDSDEDEDDDDDE
eukprot:TRINITY_DN6288_c1_g1_i1.p1 TRINITY_DN6288_c1_g1~~TRINITY_DN6288_c1_g1_i1.p1  ORF type:complete len:119 (+),score=36.17 TRINITY_DN6288_c1_g1_i1:38-358(+)